MTTRSGKRYRVTQSKNMGQDRFAGNVASSHRRPA